MFLATPCKVQHRVLMPSFQSGCAKEPDPKSNGDPLHDGKLGLLKGAARVHTAIALVIFLWRRGDKVVESPKVIFEKHVVKCRFYSKKSLMVEILISFIVNP